MKCSDCDASIAIADDALKGEIVACPDCGLDFEVVAPGATPTIKALVIEKEDWGE
ncbi:MAG TPA: lysine biosynthesis protein LysW [Candidatus Bathyarchaeia archaeon]|nr:lysine biosynthesis protein LysW [Candidatus Bathyarchaeia archaeon]